MRSSSTLLRVGSGLLLAGALLVPATAGGEAGPSEPSTSGAEPPIVWSDATAEALEALPLQHGGRVKPLRTWADYKLLAIANARKVTVERGGEELKIDAVQWALDCFFDPDLAATYRVVQVDGWQRERGRR